MIGQYQLLSLAVYFPMLTYRFGNCLYITRAVMIMADKPEVRQPPALLKIGGDSIKGRADG